MATVTVASVTTKGSPYPTRVACRFQGRDGQISNSTQADVLDTLAEMFARWADESVI